MLLLDAQRRGPSRRGPPDPDNNGPSDAWRCCSPAGPSPEQRSATLAEQRLRSGTRDVPALWFPCPQGLAAAPRSGPLPKCRVALQDLSEFRRAAAGVLAGHVRTRRGHTRFVHHDLLGRWSWTLASLVPPGRDQDVARAGSELLARWAEPQRRYHDQRHLEEVLAAIDRLAPDPPAAAVLAAYWHDAVYDPRAADNEERSARLAADVLDGLGTAPELVAEVARLVRATAAHVVDLGDVAGVLLNDADLAVLAAPAERYEAYSRDVRAEYAHVPDDAFAAGRSALLRGLVDRPRLYAGRRPEWEVRARANVDAELRRLNAACGAGPPRPAA